MFMKMGIGKDIVFAISKVGASHLPKGVRCQDYSLKYEDAKVQLIIVCDGHGSKTYVRSDVGSRLAGEVTKEALLNFVGDTPHILFRNRKGAVTARPEWDDSLWGASPNKPVETMTETELENYEQNQSFFEQVKDIRDIDSVFKFLFEEIYKKWVEAINKDSEDNPFTAEEKEALGNHRLEKAYGSTLMAFVKTAYYWFAFHIGDGRLITVDRHLDMVQPVPWDCNCFQNYTTSLCNTEPVKLFRYAFDGTGQFPAAVFCCSDGIEDSYGDYTIVPQRLHTFYEGLLNEFVEKGKETTEKNIEKFLPLLSEKGSKDDMSLAGIINVDFVQKAIEYHKVKREIDGLQGQLDIISKEIEAKEQEEKNEWEELMRKNESDYIE